MPAANGVLAVPANNSVMLKQRIITAVLLILAVVAAVLWLPTVILSLPLALAAALAAWEWAGLSDLANRGRLGFSAFIVAVILAGFYYLTPPWLIGLLIASLFFWTLALLAVIVCERGGLRQRPAPLFMWLIGFMILVPAWLGLLALHDIGGAYWVLCLFVLIWVADSAAYFSGRRWGRRRLAAYVSPGKTLAGLAGAIICSLLLMIIIAAFWQPGWSLALGVLLLVAVTVLASVLGDLIESLFKRLAGAKDSGSLLPGHGGLLDRVDSLTAATPVFVAGLWMLGVIK